MNYYMVVQQTAIAPWWWLNAHSPEKDSGFFLHRNRAYDIFQCISSKKTQERKRMWRILILRHKLLILCRRGFRYLKRVIAPRVSRQILPSHLYGDLVAVLKADVFYYSRLVDPRLTLGLSNRRARYSRCQITLARTPVCHMVSQLNTAVIHTFVSDGTVPLGLSRFTIADDIDESYIDDNTYMLSLLRTPSWNKYLAHAASVSEDARVLGHAALHWVFCKTVTTGRWKV